jgi:hypothetical protein
MSSMNVLNSDGCFYEESLRILSQKINLFQGEKNLAIQSSGEN